MMPLRLWPDDCRNADSVRHRHIVSETLTANGEDDARWTPALHASWRPPAALRPSASPRYSPLTTSTKKPAMQTDQLMETQMPATIATGVEFQPLPDGTFQIEFFNDDGESLHQQVMDLAVVKSIPTLAKVTLIAASVG